MLRDQSRTTSLRRLRAVTAVAAVAALLLIDGPTAGAVAAPVTTTAAGTHKVPNVVGKAGNKAKAKVKAAGFDYDFVAPKGQSVFLSSNWVVKKQTPKAGTKLALGKTVKLRVVKALKPTPSAAASAPPAVQSDPNLPAEVEAAVNSSFGVTNIRDACTDPTFWSCYVNGYAQPVPGTVVVTLQLEDDADAKTLGDGAARAILSLTGTDLPQLEFVQTVSASGAPLSIVGRSQIPLLNL